MKTTIPADYVQSSDEKRKEEKYNMIKETVKQQEFIDHSMLAPEYMRESNNFIMDLIDQPVEFSKVITHETVSSFAMKNTLSPDINFSNSIFNFVPKKINESNGNQDYVIADDVLQANAIQKVQSNNDASFPHFLEAAAHTEANNAAESQFPALSLLSGENDAELDDVNYTVDDLVQSRCSSRKVLPHKKRISRKLKAVTYNEDTTPICLNLNRQKVATEQEVNGSLAVLNNLFNCEICGYSVSSQLEFFAHLKQHYEPEASNPLIIAVDKSLNTACNISNKVQTTSVEQVFSDVDLNFSNFSHMPDNGELQTHAQLNSTVIEANVSDRHIKLENMLLEPQELNSTLKDFSDDNSQLKEFMSDNSRDTELKDFADVSSTLKEFTGVNSPLKALSDDEFSDTEDMLEGIRSVVDKVSIEDTCDGHDSFPNIRATWFPQTNADNSEMNNMDLNLLNEQDLRQPPSTELDKGLQETNVTEKQTYTSKKRYICLKCNKEFNSGNALKYHTRTHSGVRSYKCNICDKSFYQLAALKAHTRIHTGEKPFECEHCQRRFRQWSDLKYHIESIHSKEKTYVCEVCGKAFARKYSLVVHSRIHTCEKNYKCDICSQAFRASSYLITHRRRHTGEKPHVCSVCNKSFRVSGDMRRHMRIHQNTTSSESNSKPKAAHKTEKVKSE